MQVTDVPSSACVLGIDPHAVLRAASQEVLLTIFVVNVLQNETLRMINVVGYIAVLCQAEFYSGCGLSRCYIVGAVQELRKFDVLQGSNSVT